MKAEQLADARWTVRCAPYGLFAGALGLIITLLWACLPFSYLTVAVLSGALGFVFHLLRWRTGRGWFQLGAMASGFLPLFVIIQRLHDAEAFQYVAVVALTYYVAVLVFRRRILEH
jgi:hypothetical protein